jgi:hypothetical protein
MKNHMNCSAAGLLAAMGLVFSHAASSDLVANIDTLAYGTIPQNSQSYLEVIITNTSTTQYVTDIATEINGNNSNFYFTSGCPAILGPTAACYLLVTFQAPDHPGKSKRTLTVSGTEGVNQLSADVSLEGFSAQ